VIIDKLSKGIAVIPNREVSHATRVSHVRVAFVDSGHIEESAGPGQEN
jgi:hypothetical protein